MLSISNEDIEKAVNEWYLSRSRGVILYFLLCGMSDIDDFFCDEIKSSKMVSADAGNEDMEIED